MALKTLDYTITGVSSGNLIQLTVNEAYNTPARSAVLNVSDTTLDLGDAISISIGFTGDVSSVFQGFVTHISKSTPGYEITITCEDVLTKALNYFIASDNPDNPLTYSNITSQSYVESILAVAEITNFEADVPLTFTWATDAPAEVNLVSAWQAASEMASMLAWYIYADRNGKVWFIERPPYIKSGGETDDFQFDETAGTNVLSLSYRKSTEETRNRVVVYGRQGIQATASQARGDILYSASYFKTAVVAHPLIQTQSQAQTTADYNLDLYNRLTEVVQMEVEGDPTLEINQIIEVTGSTFTGIGTSDWFLYQLRHNFSPNGYTVNMTLTK